MNKRIILPVVLFIFIAGFGVRVSAQSKPNDAQLSAIKTSCLNIQATLDRIHKSDATMRVNRGQLYESVLNNFMTKFSDRLSANRYNNTQFVAVINQYRFALEEFRGNYYQHEVDLDELLHTSCSKNPEDFYKKLGVAQKSRAVVYDNIQSLNVLMKSYNKLVLEFKSTYQDLDRGQ